MRKLMWFTLGFGTACGISAYLPDPKHLLIPIMLLTGFCLLVFRKRSVFKPIGLVLLGIIAGLIWFLLFNRWYLEPVYHVDGITQNAEIRCTNDTEETEYGCQVSGIIHIRNRQYPVRVYLKNGIRPETGTILSGEFLFKVTAPGGLKESTYYQGERIFLLAYQQKELMLTDGEPSWRDFPAIMRQKFLSLLEQNLPETGFPFAKALLLGDSSGLSYGVLTDLTVSGVRHIVAVSGLHVSILFGLISSVTIRKRYLTALSGIPVLILFAAMTGFTPSVCRACMMIGLMLFASVLDREYDGPSALSFAGLVLLLVNPLVITSVSYQLSFTSVAGIFAFSPAIRKSLQGMVKIPSRCNWYHKIMHGIVLSVSVTLGATLATIPLCAVYFGTVSLASVLTNLLVLWAVSVIFYGVLAMCLIGIFWPGAGLLLGKAVTVLIGYVIWTVEKIADFPLSAVYTQSPYIVAWLVFAYILLGVFALHEKRKVCEISCGLAVGLCIALLASWSETAWNDVLFTVLDVGQGQCILVQTEGRTYMVDCGGSSDSMAADAAAETLLSQGVSRLDGLILTHYDKDHAGGVENLISRIDVDLMILPPVCSDIPLNADKIVYACENLMLTMEKSEIYIYSSGNVGMDNENSLCILFDSENCDILITGDRSLRGEHSLLQQNSLGDVDVLVAGHHGSAESTGDELLAAVQPEIVCISAGAGNIYGHPHRELLHRLESYGCEVYRTDLNGDIVVRR